MKSDFGMYKYWLVVGIDWYNMFLAFDWQRFVCNIFFYSFNPSGLISSKIPFTEEKEKHIFCYHI